MSVYHDAIADLKKTGNLCETDKIIVACGGDHDARVWAWSGCKSVVITNVDDQYDGYCEPFEWKFADVEALDLPDGACDWGVVHAGLHHCASPHRGLLELLRVARKGVLIVEARDSLLMSAAVKLGLVPEYELESVALHRDRRGGLRNSGIPNFIYRWTENEVRKTVESAHAEKRIEYRFFYGLLLPGQRMTMASLPKQLVFRAVSLIARAIFFIAPRQGNQFAFAVIKTGEDKPWISRATGEPMLATDFKLGFRPEKYRI